MSFLEKFLSLPVEKRNIIIDAALTAFGANGYKKTSTSDIAVAAGISKAMVFHYFGSKKALYLYLIDLSGNIVVNEIIKAFDSNVTDFFERIMLSVNLKIAVIKKHPAILAFLTSMYFETDEEVKEDIKAILAKGEIFRTKLVFDGIDASKFKEGVDLKVFMKMINWIGEGFVNHSTNWVGLDIDAMCKEFDDCLNMLKNNFYKEEYL